jgi:hypothetical protein
MKRYVFPCIGLKLAEGDKATSGRGINLIAAKNIPSIFDFATLGGSHSTHVDFQLLHPFLRAYNSEIEITIADQYSDAQDFIKLTQLMFYIQGWPPFLIPFGLSHSLNEISGINSRDSEILVHKLPENMRNGLRTAEHQVETWLHEPSLYWIGRRDFHAEPDQVRDEQFVWIVDQVFRWINLESKQPELRAARNALLTAPMILDVGSSLLHIWQGIESLFPEIHAEVVFRISILISELAHKQHSPLQTWKKVRRSYGARSKVAHGSSGIVKSEDWKEAWDLLCLCLIAVRERGKMPREVELLEELLKRGG